MPDKNKRPMQDLRTTVWIGRQGCTYATIGEIMAQLKKRRIVKVKWLQSIKVNPRAVADQVHAVLLEVRGRTMVLAEKGKTAGPADR